MKQLTLFILLVSCLTSTTLFAQTEVQVVEQFEDLAPLFTPDDEAVYVVNFWATWCKPCVEELPFLEQIHDRFAGENIRVILVSLDFPDKIESKVIPFVEENQLRSEVIVLTDGKYNDWIGLVEERWDGAIPVTLFYQKDQRHFVGGAFHDFEEIETILLEMLQE